jgi:hypothetical protein
LFQVPELLRPPAVLSAKAVSAAAAAAVAIADGDEEGATAKAERARVNAANAAWVAATGALDKLAAALTKAQVAQNAPAKAAGGTKAGSKRRREVNTEADNADADGKQEESKDTSAASSAAVSAANESSDKADGEEEEASGDDGDDNDRGGRGERLTDPQEELQRLVLALEDATRILTVEASVRRSQKRMRLVSPDDISRCCTTTSLMSCPSHTGVKRQAPFAACVCSHCV